MSPVSLLWPKGDASTPTARLSEQVAADLHLDQIVRALVTGAEARSVRVVARQRFAHQILTHLLLEAEVIRHRQAVLADLLENPVLHERLEQLLPLLEALGDVGPGERFRPTAEIGLERVARRLADLELLVEVVAGLADGLNQGPTTRGGLRSV